MSVKGVLPVVPTPFLEGRFDEPSFVRLIEHMSPGVDGFVLLGSTGEAPSMTTSERMEIAAAVLAITPAEMKVVVGVAHTSADDAIELARHAEEHGAAAVLVPAPFYFPNQADGVLSFLGRIDAAIGIDLVLYDNPAATKTELRAAGVIEWAGSLEHLGAVKLTDHDLTKIEPWQRAGLTVLGGDDPIAFRYMAAGVDGVMIIVPALCPTAFRQCWDLLRDGDLDAAYSVFSAEILPITHAFGIGDEIATSKAILQEMGVFTSAEVRTPLVASDLDRRRLLSSALRTIATAPSETGS
ncbi:MAG TPA: dihydrodipicolinate synthase family protein [Solirubrobacterales bacterium]|nr:dihydrodipicolinate synthase family protein [Solirubrobacterales bacterium]